MQIVKLKKIYMERETDIMKIVKKLLVLMTCTLVLLGTAACGNTTNTDDNAANQTTQDSAMDSAGNNVNDENGTGTTAGDSVTNDQSGNSNVNDATNGTDGNGIMNDAVDDVTDGVDDVTDGITDGVDQAADDLTRDENAR